ncbi:10798_t:CDS:2 [Ambispora gerdemannii]|uniref:10798_t:CDS:1 n=1 Tax=Ambispora gerdemannii TaxID=144530 RepID=A0A9N8WL08_9GLOM|nr:10798_t:CDS:2 [Ambispora gerdemannii]
MDNWKLYTNNRYYKTNKADDEENVTLINNVNKDGSDTDSFMSDLSVNETQEKFTQLKITRDEENNYNNQLTDFVENNHTVEKLSQTPIIEQPQKSYNYIHNQYTQQDFRQTGLDKRNAFGNFVELYRHFYTDDRFVRDLSVFVYLEQLVIYLERNIHTLASEVTMFLPSIIELVARYVPEFEIVFVEHYKFNGHGFYGIINVAELLVDLDAGDIQSTTSSTTNKYSDIINDSRVKANHDEPPEYDMSIIVECNTDVNDVSDIESITTEGGEWHCV